MSVSRIGKAEKAKNEQMNGLTDQLTDGPIDHKVAY